MRTEVELREGLLKYNFDERRLRDSGVISLEDMEELLHTLEVYAGPSNDPTWESAVDLVNGYLPELLKHHNFEVVMEAALILWYRAAEPYCIDTSRFNEVIDKARKSMEFNFEALRRHEECSSGGCNHGDKR